jgi:hypothetical protein
MAPTPELAPQLEFQQEVPLNHLQIGDLVVICTRFRDFERPVTTASYR